MCCASGIPKKIGNQRESLAYYFSRIPCSPHIETEFVMSQLAPLIPGEPWQGKMQV